VTDCKQCKVDSLLTTVSCRTFGNPARGNQELKYHAKNQLIDESEYWKTCT
jgi:hypothetical protein